MVIGAGLMGLFTAYLRGLSIEKALKYATCCGLQNVRVLDAVSGVNPWEKTTAMLQNGIPMIDAHIEADGWTWSEDHALWAGPNDPLS